MSGPFGSGSNIPSYDAFDPSFSVGAGSMAESYSSMTGPVTQFDAVAFWYRPEPHEIVYPGDSAMYGVGVAPPDAVLDVPASVKHRRTRSGCFTCRSRRVKCDETRPVCDRCQKGNRTCEFPQPSASKKLKFGEARNTASETTTRPTPEEKKLETIKDEFEGEEDADLASMPGSSTRPNLGKTRTSSSQSTGRKQRTRKPSESSGTREKPSSPSTEASGSYSGSQTPASALATPPLSKKQNLHLRWRMLKPDLSPDVATYLQFQHDHMTHFHYLYKLDAKDFLHNQLIEMALQFEPLLNAVVAFAAYHYTLQLPERDQKFDAFWEYYCRSITSLRRWFKTHAEASESVLLTILQLATFEEYLGDWTHLASHHRAAHSILTTLYTPSTIMSTETSRRIFDWYCRFDLISGLMAGNAAVLDRAWLATAASYYEFRANEDEAETADMLAYIVSNSRLIAFDMACLFANPQQETDFVGEVQNISVRLDNIRKEIEQLNDSQMANTEQETSLDKEEPFDAQVPLFRESLWPLNFIWIDWYGIVLMHKYSALMASMAMPPSLSLTQLAQEQAPSGARVSIPTEPPKVLELPQELGTLSKIQCQIYEAVERSTSAPRGAILGCQASLGLSTVFLPKEERYTLWARRKLANIERLGYIWPPQFRQKMSQFWGIEEVLDWWLPNAEGKVKLLDEIRLVVEDRNRDAAEQKRRTGVDDGRTDLREIKAIFENLDLGRPNFLGLRRPSGTADLSSPSDTSSGRGG